MTSLPLLRYQEQVLKLISIVMLLAAGLVAASPEEEVRAAEKAWIDAVVKREYAALERIYTPDLLYAHSTGNLENLEEYMTRLKQGKQRYDTMTYEKTKVTVHGNAVVHHGIARFTGKNDNGAFNDHLMVMHFWVKKGKDWRLVAHQTTRIP